MPADDVQVPESLEGLTTEELVALDQALTAQFEALYRTEGGLSAEQVAELSQIGEHAQRVRTEFAARQEAAEENQARADALAAEVLGQEEEPEPELEAEPEPDPESVPEPEAEAEPEPALAAATIPAQSKRYPKLNVPLSEIRKRAPAVDAPALPRTAVVTASADSIGTFLGLLDNIEMLGRAMHDRAKGLPLSHVGAEGANYVEVARLKNEFNVTVDGERTREDDMLDVLKQVTNPQALVAGGGWCAPSETRYSFFNVACEDGLLDLPTFGVQRGGIRFPVSPTLADVFTGAFDVTTNPWLWTETDDIATVTGGPNKPCVRVPCPTFTDVRLECYGICLTAGNLADAAYPEATAHRLGLLNSAMVHATNARYIAQILALTSPTGCTAIGAAGSGAAAPLLGAVELAAIDFRTRYGMCDTDILEVILPTWAKGVIRSDLAKRSGVDLLAISDARIADFFDVRSVRVQYVQDWQTRGAGQIGSVPPVVLWPTTVNFEIMAAGSVALGNGPEIRLGVVRDSVLNAENDHTAAWMESCHLIARFGPAPRCYAVAICTDGTVGAADLTACGV